MSDPLPEIIEGLIAYAEARGIPREQYRIFVSTRSAQWGVYRVIFAANAFSGIGDRDWFDVMKFLERRWINRPNLRMALGLTVNTLAAIEAGGFDGLPEGYRDYRQVLGYAPSS